MNDIPGSISSDNVREASVIAKEAFEYCSDNSIIYREDIIKILGFCDPATPGRSLIRWDQSEEFQVALRHAKERVKITVTDNCRENVSKIISMLCGSAPNSSVGLRDPHLFFSL